MRVYKAGVCGIWAARQAEAGGSRVKENRTRPPLWEWAGNPVAALFKATIRYL